VVDRRLLSPWSFAILGLRRRRGRHWTLATAAHMRHSCRKMPSSADAAGFVQPSIAARSCVGALSNDGRQRWRSEPRCAITLPISAASHCTRPGSSSCLQAAVQVGRGARHCYWAAPAPPLLPRNSWLLLRSTREHACGQGLVRALERPHRTPFKLRLKAQAGQGMRSEGQGGVEP